MMARAADLSEAMARLVPSISLAGFGKALDARRLFHLRSLANFWDGPDGMKAFFGAADWVSAIWTLSVRTAVLECVAL